MRKGLYQLLIRLDQDEVIPVGKLGTFRFPAGFYVYTGSAMGGLDARIARHLSKTKRFHWHVDYLLERSTIVRYAIRELESHKVRKPKARSDECSLNDAILAAEGAQIPVRGFGSSDCECMSHLVYFDRRPQLSAFDFPLSTEVPESELCADGRQPL